MVENTNKMSPLRAAFVLAVGAVGAFGGMVVGVSHAPEVAGHVSLMLPGASAFCGAVAGGVAAGAATSSRLWNRILP